MSDKIILNNNYNLTTKECATKEILDLNKITEKYGLTLSEGQVDDLLETKQESLRENQLFEVGNTVLTGLIINFCNSGYMDKEDYLGNLEGLTEVFYTLRKSLPNTIEDEQIIEYMKKKFENNCNGIVEDLLSSNTDDFYEVLRGENE